MRKVICLWRRKCKDLGITLGKTYEATVTNNNEYYYYLTNDKGEIVICEDSYLLDAPTDSDPLGKDVLYFVTEKFCQEKKLIKHKEYEVVDRINDLFIVLNEDGKRVSVPIRCFLSPGTGLLYENDGPNDFCKDWSEVIRKYTLESFKNIDFWIEDHHKGKLRTKTRVSKKTMNYWLELAGIISIRARIEELTENYHELFQRVKSMEQYVTNECKSILGVLRGVRNG